MDTMIPPKLSIVISIQPAHFEAVAYKGNFEVNLRRIASYGYTGAELAIRDPNVIDVDGLKATLRLSGLSVPAIGTGQAWGEEKLSFSDPDIDVRRRAIERIKGHIRLAKGLDAMVIIGLIRGVTQAGQAKSQSMSYLRECLGECCQEALTQNVRLALEPLNRYETDLIHTANEGLELIHQIGAPNLGLLLDTFHMNIEEESIEICIRRCDTHIFHFHIADSNRKYPGAGHLDFASILQVLYSTGYPGWISGEFMPLPDSDSAAQRCVVYLQRLRASTKPDRL